MQKKLPIEEAVLKFYSPSVETAPQPINIEEWRKVGSVVRITSNANLDAGEIRRHINRAPDCKLALDNSMNWSIAGEFFEKIFVQSGGDSSASEAVLYKKNVLVVLRRQVAVSSWKDLFSTCKMFQNGRRILLLRCSAGIQNGRCGRD